MQNRVSYTRTKARTNRPTREVELRILRRKRRMETGGMKQTLRLVFCLFKGTSSAASYMPSYRTIVSNAIRK
jgi:hypothetical protein